MSSARPVPLVKYTLPAEGSLNRPGFLIEARFIRSQLAGPVFRIIGRLIADTGISGKVSPYEPR
jgi:hypothetical protein